jgi:hypothetical protein
MSSLSPCQKLDFVTVSRFTYTHSNHVRTNQFQSAVRKGKSLLNSIPAALQNELIFANFIFVPKTVNDLLRHVLTDYVYPKLLVSPKMAIQALYVHIGEVNLPSSRKCASTSLYCRSMDEFWEWS